MAPLYQDAFKSEKFSGGTYMSYAYPKLPYNIDFETYRKTDPQWKKIVAMRNAPATSFGIVHEPDSHSERFIVSRWPRDPDGQVLSATPVGKVTPNGGQHCIVGFWPFKGFHSFLAQDIHCGVRLSMTSIWYIVILNSPRWRLFVRTGKPWRYSSITDAIT